MSGLTLNQLRPRIAALEARRRCGMASAEELAELKRLRARAATRVSRVRQRIKVASAKIAAYQQELNA